MASSEFPFNIVPPQGSFPWVPHCSDGTWAPCEFSKLPPTLKYLGAFLKAILLFVKAFVVVIDSMQVDKGQWVERGPSAIF